MESKMPTTSAVAPGLPRLRRWRGIALALLVLGVLWMQPTVARAASADAPYRMIVLLQITYASGGQAGCTGFMIGPHTVGTAGHCLVSPTAGKATQVRVTPGLDGLDAPYASVQATSFSTTTLWANFQDDRSDFGTITLPSDALGNATGWFRSRSASSAELTTGVFSTAGYPAVRTLGTLVRVSGSINGVDASYLYYRWNTTEGDSGSPIWTQDATGDGYSVVGIVKAYVVSSETGAVITDKGIRITASVATFLLNAINAPVAAAAQPSIPTLFSVPAGQPATVSGAGWPASSAAALQQSSDLVHWSPILSGSSDAQGNVAFRITPAATAYYRIVTVGAAPGDAGQGAVTGTSTSAPSAGGKFASAPVFGAGSVAQVVFEGGTVQQLEAAVNAAVARGVWSQDAAGTYRLLAVGAPSFVQAPFVAAF
ncbi:MAG: trypsin-like serine protease, partial [Chloroflexota bacterium]